MTTTTITKQAENPEQDSEPTSYATRLAHGQLTHNAANEIDQEVSQTRNRPGDGGKQSGTSEDQGQGRSSDRSGESTSGSFLSLSSLAANESSASSFMGNDSGTFAGHSDEDLGPEHIMHMLSQASQSSQQNWNNLGNSAPGAGQTGQMENQTSATPAAQDNPNQSPSLLASLNPTQLANEGIADFSQGLQMLMQDSSNNPAAAQNDVLLAQTGLAMANLGLDLYQLDTISGSGAGATTLPGGDITTSNPPPPASTTAPSTTGGDSGTTTTTGGVSGTTTSTAGDSGTTTTTGGDSGTTATTGGDSGTTNPITSLQGSDPTLSNTLTDASTQVTNENLTSGGFSQFENNVQALQQGVPFDGSQYPDDASLLNAALQPQQGQQALSAGDKATLQQVINNDATGSNDNYVSTYNPINDQNIQSMLIQGLAPDQGQDPLAGEVLTDAFNGGKVSAAGYAQFDQIVTQAETGVDGYGNDTDLLNGSLQQFQQQGGAASDAASDAAALQNVIIGDTGETSTGSTTSGGSDSAGNGSTTSGGSDSAGNGSTTSGGSDSTASEGSTASGSTGETGGNGAIPNPGQGSAALSVGATPESPTQDQINMAVNPNNTQVWLTADANAPTGDGSSASAPEYAGTPALFDSITQNQANTTFRLEGNADGSIATYQTNGGSNDIGTNEQIIGSGWNSTTIKDVGNTDVFNSYTGTGSGFTLAGVAVDLNGQLASAVDDEGVNNVEIYGNEIENYASPTQGHEEFPVLIRGDNNNRIEANSFTTSTTGNQDGLSIASILPASTNSTNSAIDDNWFIDSPQSDFSYSHAGFSTNFVGNYVSGVQTGYYIETGHGDANQDNLSAANITNNTFGSGVTQPFNVQNVSGRADTPGTNPFSLNFDNNTILNGGGHGAVTTTDDGSPIPITGAWTVANNSLGGNEPVDGQTQSDIAAGGGTLTVSGNA